MTRDREKIEQALIALGENAADAASMARAEIERDSPQLARSVFLRMAWDLVAGETTTSTGERTWIEGWLRWSRSQGKPAVGVGAALERLLACGIDPRDLTDVVRAMQHDLLLNLCDLLDEMGVRERCATIPDMPDVGWRLYEVDEHGAPARAIESLGESVSGYDPTGREGQPSKR